MLDQVHEAIAASTTTPHEKHVDVLLKTSALCREIGGTVAILCKSGECVVRVCFELFVIYCLCLFR